MKIALLGAESTGKTQLAHALAARLQARGRSAIAVDEYLREWCDTHARTPSIDEQAAIAQTQQNRIETAAATSSYVIADTTPLMTAIYSEYFFQDTRLSASALAYQKTFALTLLTGLDLPWQADGIQRDGAHVRASIDALIRTHLQSASIPFELIYGTGSQRNQNAIDAIERYDLALDAIEIIANSPINTPPRSSNDSKLWQWQCDTCSDADCEHQLFRQLIDRELKS
jgi:nicotinamide riboside kinase